MMNTSLYQNLPDQVPELTHPLGARVHLLADVVMLTDLAELSQASATTARVNQLVRGLYLKLLHHVMLREFPRLSTQLETRMSVHTKQGVWSGEILNRETPVVVTAVARAGVQPAQTCFEYLCETMNEGKVRQDHLYMNRATDEAGRVIGTHFSGSKIGGPVEGALVLIPEPMGATGGSLARTIRHYSEAVPGQAHKFIALNLIVTPEYVAHMTEHHPDVAIYAVRYDRGMSSDALLQGPIVGHQGGERGLNDKHYIVPGLGGLGELLNNSFV